METILELLTYLMHYFVMYSIWDNILSKFLWKSYGYQAYVLH